MLYTRVSFERARAFVLCAVLSSGCSFVRTRTEPPCTGRVHPLIDLGITAVSVGALLLVAHEACDGDCATRDPAVAAIGTLGVSAIAFGASATYGFRGVAACRQEP